MTARKKKFLRSTRPSSSPRVRQADGADLTRAVAARARARKKLRDNRPDRLLSVDLSVWTDAELEALAMWIEQVQEERREREQEAIDAKRAETVVSTRYARRDVKCGKPNCRCAQGELHEGFWYAYETLGNGRRRTRYHGKEPPPALARQVSFKFKKRK